MQIYILPFTKRKHNQNTQEGKYDLFKISSRDKQCANFRPLTKRQTDGLKKQENDHSCELIISKLELLEGRSDSLTSQISSPFSSFSCFIPVCPFVAY